MSGENRRLSHFNGQPENDANPGAEPDGVDADPGHAQRVAEQLAMADDDDRPDHVSGDVEDDDSNVGNDDETCRECGASAWYDDPAEALDSDALPSKPLCRSCIFDHA